MEKIRDKGGRFISKGKQSKITSIESNRQKNVTVEVPSTNSQSDPNDPPPDPNDDLQDPIHILEHSYAYDPSINGHCDEEVVPDENEDTSHLIEWDTGRRILELGFVVNKLIEGCYKCKHSLNLRDICGEKRYGLGSLLHIKCTLCSTVNYVPTGKRHSRSDNNGIRAFDVNTKVALGMLHAGIGEKKLSMLLSVLNIPPLSKTSLKKSEREVGRAVEDVAKNSCKEFATAEVESFGNDDLSVSFDGGWQKRGSGRSYSSLSGHAAMIGKETGKCIAYATRNKFCRVCERAERTKKDIPEHDCRKNWSGSSKAMEPDMCIGMMKDLQDSNIHIGSIIMDNDSTTVARARAEVNPALKKQCDRNHTLKQFTNKLYELKKSKNYKELNSKTIQHLSKCFKYCISQNENDPSGMKKNLEAIGRHVYGDHTFCESWCKYLASPLTYKPIQLPYHRYLNNLDLKSDLTSLLSLYISQADKLVDLGSTQPNESLNNTIASKTPKQNFYSGSESNDFRVAAAIAQKNLGHQYVTEVNERLLLSPGEITSSNARKVDLKRKKTKETEDTRKKGHRKRWTSIDRRSQQK
ncbi:uncharacterized protein LOC134269372 [Saccostrea cucullata]|uniref:uncharacterized protein LOC134269372 n=1 Tax=Saccostrea cuccullata TaxID=36930 RepID=UPI002ED4B998